MASPSSYPSSLQSVSKKRPKVSKRELARLEADNNKRTKRDLPQCPICEYRIEPAYWADHYQYELNRLAEPTSEAYANSFSATKGKRGAAVAAKRQLEGKGKKKLSLYEETLEKIQKNRNKRMDRLKQINNKSVLDISTADTTQNDSELALRVQMEEQENSGEVQTCFICNERLCGDSEAINLHIDNCLSNPKSPSENEEQDDDDDSDIYSDTPQASSGWEEYEWAGQRRVRATAMMEGGYGGAGFATASKVEEDNDEDLDVEDDDADEYGESQYTERDVVNNGDDEDTSALRQMVSGSTGQTRQGFEESVSETGWQEHLSKEDKVPSAGRSNLLIDSLKARIHQLESASKSANCLICLEPYKTPLTSIVCWHVHCEQCRATPLPTAFHEG
ncbi:hypothetical protein A0J61_04393 [Choanephora cucurbitarum]|uniref:Uncharacterized protein n=1 Tax=Choanephora cucurbitarum TaxID=101091 RepID=A0A1C7NEN0_9FUNG|nr:hypothetical protein A0J61_04393 [Choanephora cucurbitarum]